jgi:phenylacetate-CoA ligase
MRLAYTLKNFADIAAARGQNRAREEREYWPRERLEAFQQQRLSELVEHASRHSPFYRAHYGGPIDRRDVRPGALPPVTKAMMMDRLDTVFTDRRLTHAALERHLASIGPHDDLLLGQYRVMASSGSSGRKGIYVYDRAAWRAFLGGAMRSRVMMGVVPRFPHRRRVAQIAAPDAKHMTSRAAASLTIGPIQTLRLSAAQPIDELVRTLNQYQPHAVTGYPSVVALLTTSEVRTDDMTDRMRAAWGAQPYNAVGLTETGVTAIDCAAHRGLHIFEDACLFEVVDEHGNAVPDGQPGHKVLVTNLDNRVQPFIRFEVTDLVTVTSERCFCERTFRRITAIEGRWDDILELPGARGGTVRVHPIHLRSPLAAMPTVAQYQIVEREDGLDVTITLDRVPASDFVVRAVERALRTKLNALGAAPIPIRVRIAPHIEREAGAGKLKLIVRRAAS